MKFAVNSSRRAVKPECISAAEERARARREGSAGRRGSCRGSVLVGLVLMEG